MTTEVLLRLGFSIGGLIIFMGLGLNYALQQDPLLKSQKRWVTNLTLSFGNALVLRLVVPLAIIEIVALPQLEPFRLIDWSAIPAWVPFVFGVLVLDLVIYWQHRLTHRIPILWRIHRVHHSDPVIDTTSAGRFHTIEILLSFGIKLFFALLLNLPAASIICFEILLNLSSLFNHTNIQLPSKHESWLRKILITPDLHRIHHSIKSDEVDHNFGFSTVLWDHLFSSYLDQAHDPQKTLKLGLKSFRLPKQQTFWALLVQPFISDDKKSK